MNTKQFERMAKDPGFIAALDQSGGSTPKALKLYGVDESAYKTDKEMFELVHQMRQRIIKCASFNKERILAAILFERTMNSKIDDMYTGDYLWDVKGIVPLLKVDEGLADLENGVQLMKPMQKLDALLATANEKHIFGTKMRSVIKEYNEEGIKAIVKQQFEYGVKIFKAGLVPILEPEVDIHAVDKAKIEAFMKGEIVKALEGLDKDVRLMFKFTIPTEAGLYDDLVKYEQVVRIVALSGGYSREEANGLLKKNKEMVASFSRALSEGLSAQQTEEEFAAMLDASVESIYKASVEKV